jgi:phospholipid transport system substrate-binding protein
VAAVVAAVALALDAAAAPVAPADVVRRLAEQVVEVLKDRDAASSDKRRRIETLVYAAVDFETLSRLVLARNWSAFDADQQRRFQAEFKEHLSVTYGKSIDSYKNEVVHVTGDRAEARGDWTVKTKIDREGADDVLVDYRLRQTGGEWKIIDIIVEGVSLVSNFRSQFQDLLSSKSPEQLIALIREKNQKGEAFEKAPKAG